MRAGLLVRLMVARFVVLAASPHGCTEAIMRAHGFTIGRASAGWARNGENRARGRGLRKIEVARVRITDAGRRELAERPR
jgi:hypothetical protein